MLDSGVYSPWERIRVCTGISQRLAFATLYFFELREMDYVPGLSEGEGTDLCKLPENESLIYFFFSLWLCDFLRLTLLLNLSTFLDK